MKMKNTNPTTNEVIGEIDISTPEDVHQKVAEAHAAQESWAALGVSGRVEILRDVLEKLEANLEKIGELITKSMGMPTSLRGILDTDGAIEYFKWYLENAEKCLSPEVSYEDDTSLNTVFYEPTGVAAVISPWNYPFCLFVWQVIPNLIVGNTVVYKHASECAVIGKFIEEILSSSKLPKGVFFEVYGSSEIGDALINEDIDIVSFTGSTSVGKHIYGIAAEKIIRPIMELGGSAPAIVFEDADISKVTETVFFNRFANSGQICDGLKRLIVHKNIAKKVEDALVEMLKSKKCGDPEDMSVEIGPLVSVKQADALKAQVDDALAKGATALIGGKKPEGLSEAFFEPTLLNNVTTDMKVWKEEVFGPVLPIVTFETEEEALQLANDTEYGLGGYILTEDKERASRVAAKIKTGMISVNGMLYLHPSSPFGGYKKSGIGREHGKYGFHDLCQVKVIATEK
jgi:succinate-semialdehyde dehydrogenase/glutarate-semialdehyde dehydrogenase